MFRLHGGSKLLEGVWADSAGFGSSLFELFHGDNASSLDTRSPTDTKYYTPFGSGISLGDLTSSQLVNKSCWKSESDSCNHAALKPASTMNRINHEKDRAAGESLDVGMKLSSGQLEHSMSPLMGRSFKQSTGDRNTGKAFVSIQPRNGQVRDMAKHRGMCTDHVDVKSLTGIHGDGKHLDAELREKQLQQMFMHELNRLPPDLRKQYVDYMIASHLGLLQGISPTFPAVPAVYYNTVVGPGTVPVVAQSVIVPTGTLMPTPVITLQPVVPPSAAKSQSR